MLNYRAALPWLWRQEHQWAARHERCTSPLMKISDVTRGGQVDGGCVVNIRRKGGEFTPGKTVRNHTLICFLM